MYCQKALFQAEDDDVVYLDSCTTSSTFVGEHNLTDVQDVKKGIAVQCNAGKVKTNRRGNFGSLKIWAMREGIANVLSLGEIIKKYRVTYDSLDGYFVVHTPRGKVHFVLDEHGMPALNLTRDEHAARMLIRPSRTRVRDTAPGK